MQKKIYEVKLENFARSFGTTIEYILDDCRKLISKTDFKYRLLVGKERNKVILDVIKKQNLINRSLEWGNDKAFGRKTWKILI